MALSEVPTIRPEALRLPIGEKAQVVVLTGLILLAIELSRIASVTFPIPFLILYGCIVIAGTVGGAVAGGVSGGLAALYVLYSALIGHGPEALIGTGLSAAGGASVYLMSGILIGRIRDQNEKLNTEIIRLKDGLEKTVAERTEKLLAAQKSLEETETKLRNSNRGQERELARRMDAHRLSEARLDAVFNTLVDGLIIVNDSGHIEDFNPAAEKLFGYEKGDAIGSVVDDLIPALKQDDGAGRSRNVFCSGGKGLIGKSTEFEGRRGDGTRFPILLSVGELDLGDKHMFTGVVHDISYQKEVERRLMQAKEHSETAARAKSDFLANMSHEIRTPLNGVIGMLELIKGTSLSKRQSELLNTAKASANRLFNVISDILDFSRIETSGLTITHEPFNLHQAVEDAVIAASSEATVKGIELNCYMPFELPVEVVGDAFRIKQVLTNLLSNAVKFTRVGEVNVCVSRQAELEDRVRLRFEVQDTGIGIVADKIDGLFDAFTQEDSSVTREHGGTGLGLTIARELVHLMGGRIGATSEPGEGSTFWFEIEFECAEETETLPEAGMPDGARVLIADDNQTNRDILSDYLKGWNVACDAVEDGREALKLVQAAATDDSPYNAVILDSNMPGMSGLDVARELIYEAIVPASRIIILSSTNDTEERFREAGIHNYLDKPARQLDIYSMLQRALSARGEHTSILQSSYSYGRRASDVKLSDARVLVVDDVTTNQLACKEMLRALGASCDIAMSGEEARRAVMSEDYDLVLMDCQMPEVNGLEATRAIRKWEKMNNRARMPIMAITAYPMDEDRRSCIESGMDDYLTKPFSIADLARLLTQWLPADKLQRSRLVSGKDDIKPLHHGEIELDDIFDMEVLEGLSKRKSSVLAAMVQDFNATVTKLLPALQDAVEKTDFGGIQNAAHALKEAALAVAAARMVELCETLELQALGLSLDEPQRQTGEIGAEFERAFAALERFV